jgi:Fe-S-cluster containining protein
MIAATDEDLSRWKREGRQDILDKVKVIADPKTGRVIAADLWFNPATGKEYVYCPWLRRNRDGKAACLIHGTKPQYCRDYVCRRHVKA